MRLQADCTRCPDGQGCIGKLSVAEGDRAMVSLSVSLEQDASPRPMSLESIPERIEVTLAAWRDWCAALDCPASYRADVVRSAICLTLLISELGRPSCRERGCQYG